MTPANARNARGGGRFYTWGTERYWSVTTIISGGFPKDALKWWAAKTVAEFAYDHAHEWLSMDRGRAVDYLKREPMRFTGGRADVGTAVHKAAEAIALSKPMPRFEAFEERVIVANFLDFAKTIKPKVIATEASVYHRTQRYAGTLDLIAEVDPKLLPFAHPWPTDRVIKLLIDYKTGGKVAEERGIYPETALQLNAYAHAEFIGVADGSEAPMPAVDGLAALHLGARGWRLVPIRMGDDVFKAFLFGREVFRWQEQTSKDTIGDDAARMILDHDPLEEEANAQ